MTQAETLYRKLSHQTKAFTFNTAKVICTNQYDKGYLFTYKSVIIVYKCNFNKYCF